MLFRTDKFEIRSYKRSTKYWKVWMDNLHCNGNENTILECYYDINRGCANGKDVGIRCQPENNADSEYELSLYTMLQADCPVKVCCKMLVR